VFGPTKGKLKSESKQGKDVFGIKVYLQGDGGQELEQAVLRWIAAGAGSDQGF